MQRKRNLRHPLPFTPGAMPAASFTMGVATAGAGLVIAELKMADTVSTGAATLVPTPSSLVESFEAFTLIQGGLPYQASAAEIDGGSYIQLTFPVAAAAGDILTIDAARPAPATLGIWITGNPQLVQ